MGQTTQAENTTRFGAPPALVAIIQAARRAGDWDLERAARQELAERYGIELVFRRSRRQGVARDE
jgi:hypothetical protein